jgi:hypothetical protein
MTMECIATIRSQREEGYYDGSELIVAGTYDFANALVGRVHARETQLLWVRMEANDKPEDRALADAGRPLVPVETVKERTFARHTGNSGPASPAQLLLLNNNVGREGRFDETSSSRLDERHCNDNRSDSRRSAYSAEFPGNPDCRPRL